VEIFLVPIVESLPNIAAITMKPISKIWRDPVWATVIGGLIIAVLLAFFKSWWPHITSASIRGILWAMGKTAIPNWLLILLSVCALAWVMVLVAAMSSRRSEYRPVTPCFNYYEDSFFELKWRWTYGHNWRIEKLFPFCPRCDYQIIPQELGYGTQLYQCEDCGFQKRLDMLQSEIEGRVIRSIQKKLRGAPDQSAASAP
jgi:hypothetical protein